MEFNKSISEERTQFFRKWINLNQNREGKNLIGGEGRRKDTVVMEAHDIFIRYAFFDKGTLTISEICLISGKSYWYINPEFFRMDKITDANNRED